MAQMFAPSYVLLDLQVGDQKMERGNLGLENCHKHEVPVRVIRRVQEKPALYRYDGLYKVRVAVDVPLQGACNGRRASTRCVCCARCSVSQWAQTHTPTSRRGGYMVPRCDIECESGVAQVASWRRVSAIADGGKADDSRAPSGNIDPTVFKFKLKRLPSQPPLDTSVRGIAFREAGRYTRTQHKAHATQRTTQYA